MTERDDQLKGAVSHQSGITAGVGSDTVAEATKGETRTDGNCQSPSSSGIRSVENADQVKIEPNTPDVEIDDGGCLCL